MGLNGIFWANAVSHLAFGMASFFWLKRFLRKLVSGPLPSEAKTSGLEETVPIGPIQ